MRRQVRTTETIFEEKDRFESNITPRFLADSETGQGRRGGEIRGGCRAINSDLAWFKRSRLDAAQDEISERRSERKDACGRGRGKISCMSSA